jgi:hypothetical protein
MSPGIKFPPPPPPSSVVVPSPSSGVVIVGSGGFIHHGGVLVRNHSASGCLWGFMFIIVEGAFVGEGKLDLEGVEKKSPEIGFHPLDDIFKTK